MTNEKEFAIEMLRGEFPEVPFVGTVYGVDLRELEKDDILRAFKFVQVLKHEEVNRKIELNDFINKTKLPESKIERIFKILKE